MGISRKSRNEVLHQIVGEKKCTFITVDASPPRVRRRETGTRRPERYIAISFYKEAWMYQSLAWKGNRRLADTQMEYYHEMTGQVLTHESVIGQVPPLHLGQVKFH